MHDRRDVLKGMIALGAAPLLMTTPAVAALAIPAQVYDPGFFLVI